MGDVCGLNPQAMGLVGCDEYDHISAFELPPDWTLNERQLCDLEMLLTGAFAPLKGFLNERDYVSVLNNMRLANGEVWPIPIVFALPKSATRPNNHWTVSSAAVTQTGRYLNGNTTQSHRRATRKLKLRDMLGIVVAIVEVDDIYEPDIELEMTKVLGSTDLNHPHAKYLHEHHRDCYYIGGRVIPKTPIMHFDFEEYRMTALQVREHVQQKGWEVVVGFQTRNPMHRSHFELTQQALREVEKAEGKKAHLLLSPAGGPTQIGDVDYPIRMRCYQRILKYYDLNSVHMVMLPLAMRMAGPREAVWHAIIRRNYGCTHFIVGRDHAGPSAQTKDGKPFYEPYEAHDLLKTVQDELGIKPVFGKAMVYVGEEHGGYVESSCIPEGVEAQNISGTRLREMLQTREDIPEWFSFPEVVEELHKFYRPRHERGFCVYFTGLPCSGKSTLASAVEAVILENKEDRRRVSLLDADIVRTHLSKGLGFSQEERSINVRRIGYVASEIVKHGGICLIANIAPYEDDRQFNRRLIGSTGGGYLEVYVSTPIEVCEDRDVKELYKKARQGVIKQFTGVSDPYQVPKNAELVVNCSDDIKGKVRMVVDYLKCQQWLP